ncbi:unnamed protein product [Allacma fusca]|uniref:Uncharacterized protein n=1 Tax=Allacma fusca TaxID=39272 RepID=A0A8J2L6H4_9HEXA|nr:unnamed protein product [Allacma fusca]
MKLKKTPKWWGANVKFSMPTTVFFDKLKVPAHSPPLVLFPFGPVFPPKRTKRSSENDSILSLPPPESVKGGERAILVPRIENLLKSYGLDGRGCFLRAVCEVHQTPLISAYGFLGEVLTLLFSVSNSPYAKSHLREYLIAEDMGKNGQCESYYRNCTESILIHHDEL